MCKHYVQNNTFHFLAGWTRGLTTLEAATETFPLGIVCTKTTNAVPLISMRLFRVHAWQKNINKEGR